jgi:hypothetical protein
MCSIVYIYTYVNLTEVRKPWLLEIGKLLLEIGKLLLEIGELLLEIGELLLEIGELLLEIGEHKFIYWH